MNSTLTTRIMAGYIFLLWDLTLDFFGQTSVLQWRRVYKLLTISDKLYNSAKDGNYKTCKELLFMKPEVNIKDKDGRSPLYFICKDGNLEIVKKFLDAHASGFGCLEVALEFYYIDVAKLLLENKISISPFKYTNKDCHLNRFKNSEQK